MTNAWQHEVQLRKLEYTRAVKLIDCAIASPLGCAGACFTGTFCSQRVIEMTENASISDYWFVSVDFWFIRLKVHFSYCIMLYLTVLFIPQIDSDLYKNRSFD